MRREQNNKKLTIHTGDVVDFESGSAFKLAGTDVTVALANATIPANRAETVAATRPVTAAETGKTFFLSHATEFVCTLPAPAAGLSYSFIVANAPESADYTIVSASAANIILGHVLSSDLDAAGDGDSEPATGGDTISFVASKAVLGDRVDVISDGTNWFVRASCAAFDAITITTAA